MGGAVTVNYLTSPACPLKACVINQSPFNCGMAIKSLTSQALGAYDRFIGLNMKYNIILKHKEDLQHNPVFKACITDEKGKVRVPSTIGEIDE